MFTIDRLTEIKKIILCLSINVSCANPIVGKKHIVIDTKETNVKFARNTRYCTKEAWNLSVTNSYQKLRTILQ